MGSNARVVAAVLALALASAVESRAQEEGPGPAPAATPAEAPAPAPTPEEVKFQTEDGVEIHADLYAAGDPNAHSVILLHAHRKDRTIWGSLLPSLTGAGFNVLNLDLRGHGDSTRKGESTLDADDVPLYLTGRLIVDSTRDVLAALAFLEERGIQTERVAIVGDTYGAMLSFLTAGQRPDSVRCLVLLSAPEEGWGINIRGHAKSYPGKIMAIVDKRDPIAAPGTKIIIDMHPGYDPRLEYDRGGRGTVLLDTYPETRQLITEFIKRTLDAK
jgi:pimeloyl-ACP methyl ester carboxylesterase